MKDVMETSNDKLGCLAVEQANQLKEVTTYHYDVDKLSRVLA